MRKIGDRSEQESDLIVNRVSYHLMQGTSEHEILPEMIGFGVTKEELPLLIRLSRERTAEADMAYRLDTRRSAMGWIAFGAAMLALAFYLSEGDVPLMRQGRLTLGWIMGGVALVYGLWRYIDPSYKDY